MTRTTSVEGRAAPIGSAASGRLVFTKGVSHLTIRGDGTLDDLFRARFEGKVPDILVDGGAVSVRYRPTFHPPHGELTLSGRVPWTLEAPWGMSERGQTTDDRDDRSERGSGPAAVCISTGSTSGGTAIAPTLVPSSRSQAFCVPTITMRPMNDATATAPAASPSSNAIAPPIRMHTARRGMTYR
jgi:hypothetical protein